MFERALPPIPEFIAHELPFSRRMYRVENGRYAGKKIHLIDHGPRDQPPVLLLHGNPTWSFLWRKVIRRLSGFRVVAPDLIGLGFSDRLPNIDDHRLTDHGDALSELVEALDLQGAVIVGQDWGGPMMTSIGARQPQRFVGAVIANTAVVLPERPRGTTFHKLARTPVISDLLFRVAGFPLGTLHKVQGDPDSIRGDVAKAYRWPLRRMRERIAPLALARMVPDGPNHPSVEPLRRGERWITGFEGPVALVWGTRDPILGRALSRHQRGLPKASVRTTEAGHFLQEEVPDVLTEAIQEVAAGSAY